MKQSDDTPVTASGDRAPVQREVILIAADHNGVELKAQAVEHLERHGYHPIDLGAYTAERHVDYVDYATQLAMIIERSGVRKGILICGTGVGMSIVANKFPHIRAALVHDLESSAKSREHNDANVLCLGAWITAVRLALQIVDNWLNEPFGEGRHVKRIEKMVPHDRDKLVFTNGVFDVLHTGHIELLRFAKSLGGRLIVGINSDRAVKELKGESRPVNNENERKLVLESISYVDEVIIFDDTKSLPLIQSVHPDIVVKGGEWTPDQVRQRDGIPQEIEVKICPLVSDYSTTNLLDRITKSKTWKKTPLP